MPEFIRHEEALEPVFRNTGFTIESAGDLTADRAGWVRIITATNSDLERLMSENKFLPDLYDRLSFEVIHIPPLRARRALSEVLAKHFLNRFMQEVPAFQCKQLSRAALDCLKRYHFPGNVRELKNTIERAVYRDTTNEITPEDIGTLSTAEIARQEGTFKDKMKEFASRLIFQTLYEVGQNQAEATRRHGLSYHQFRYYHQKYSSAVGWPQ